MRKQDMTHTMRQPLVALLLALMLVVAGAGPARADVLYDGNGNAATGTTLGFTVPAEEDRLLVVCVALGNGSVSGVTFDGTAMTRAIEQMASSRFGVSIWVLPLGSSGSPDTGNIVASGSGIPYLGAASFHGVDQADPVDGATWVQIPGGATFSSLEVESESGDQVFDCLHGFSWPAFTATPVGGQSRIMEAGNSMWSFAGGTVAGSDGPVPMDWEFSPNLFDTGMHAGININSSGGTTAVDLVSFTAAPQGDTVRLAWETASEVDNLGFHVYRQAGDGERVQLNDALIPSQNLGSPVGAAYEFVDDTAEPGVAYAYWLADVDLGGMETLHGPATASIKLILQRPLPVRRLLPPPVLIEPGPVPLPIGPTSNQ